jgi:hypothetical protein
MRAQITRALFAGYREAVALPLLRLGPLDKRSGDVGKLSFIHLAMA